MKDLKARAIALTLALLLALPSVLTACNQPATESAPNPWDVTEQDVDGLVVADISSVVDSAGNCQTTIASDEVNFSADTGAENVKISLAPILVTDSEGEGQSYDFGSPIVVQASSVVLVDGKLQISFPCPTEGSYALEVVINKEGTKEQKLVSAADVIRAETLLTAPLQKTAIGVNTAIYYGMENPVIELNIFGASFVNSDISMIHPEGTLSGLTVANAYALGSRMIISLKGTVHSDGANNLAYIYLDSGITSSKQDEFVGAYTRSVELLPDVNSISYSAGSLKIKVNVSAPTFDISESELLSKLSVEGHTVKSVSIASDKTYFTMTLKPSGSTEQQALTALRNALVSISSLKLEGRINAPTPTLSATMLSVERVKGTRWSACIRIALNNGSFARALGKSDVLFTDLSFGEVTAVKKDGESYLATIEFDKHTDSTQFSTTVSLKEGVVLDKLSVPANPEGSYAFKRIHSEIDPDSPVVPIDDVVLYMCENLDAPDLLSLVVSAGGLASTLYADQFGSSLTYVKQLLGLVGIIEDKSSIGAAYESITSQLSVIKAELDLIQNELHILRSELESYSTEIIDLIQKERVSKLCAEWSDFCENYINTLEATVNAYEAAVRSDVTDYFRRAYDSEFVIDVYYDMDDHPVFVHDDDPSHTIDAQKVKRSEHLVVLHHEFNNTSAAFAKAGGYVMTPEVIDAIILDLKGVIERNKAIGNTTLEPTDDNAIMLYDYICGGFSVKKLMNGDWAERIVSGYVRLCKKIGSSDVKSIISSYDELISFKYAFQSEARSDMEDVRDYLTLTMYRFASIAATAEKYGMAGGSLSFKATKEALQYILDNTGLREVPEGTDYCYVVGRPISLRVGGVTQKITADVEVFEIPQSDPFGGVFYIDAITFKSFSFNGPQYYVYKNADGSNASQSYSSTELLINNSALVSGSQLNYISKRYLANYKDGNDFAGYLISRLAPEGYENENLTPTKIVTKIVHTGEAPLDGSFPLVCLEGSADSYGKYFKKGNTYHPISADCSSTKAKNYIINSEVVADVFDTKTLSSVFNYCLSRVAGYAQKNYYIDEYGVLQSPDENGAYIYLPIY